MKQHTDFDQILLRGRFHFCLEKYIFILWDRSSRQNISYLTLVELGKIDIR